MGTYSLQNSHHSYYSGNVVDGESDVRKMGSFKSRSGRIYRNEQKMKLFMFFHHMMFVIVLMAVFFAGALNAGREAMLNDLLADTLTHMSLTQLSNISVI